MRQKFHAAAHLLGGALKYINEAMANATALFLRVFYAGQVIQKFLARVDHLQFHIKVVAKRALHQVALVLAQQTVVHKYAGHLPRHRARDQRRGHGAVHSARKTANHAVFAHLLAHARHFLIQKIRHGPTASATAGLLQKVAQNVHATWSVRDLGMKLHAPKFLRAMFHGRGRTRRRASKHFKIIRQASDLVAVAHPHRGGR